MRAEIQQVGNHKRLFLYISFSQFAREFHGCVSAYGMKQRQVWRALRADRVTANEHNLLARLNTRPQQNRIHIGKHIIHGDRILCKMRLNAPQKREQIKCFLLRRKSKDLF